MGGGGEPPAAKRRRLEDPDNDDHVTEDEEESLFYMPFLTLRQYLESEESKVVREKIATCDHN